MPQPLDSRYLTDEWVDSKSVGGVSEVTLFTPITPGFIPGEARTYEERLRSVLASVQRRAVDGTPTPIGLMPTIHYARWVVLRPGQYLQYCGYPAHPVDAVDQARPQASENRLDTNDGLPYGHRSWLYFTLNFDGDMKTYLRDFSVKLGKDVDRIWGNCEGYPVGGAADFDAYWEYAKRHQIETHAFYNAYPHLNVPEIHALAGFRRQRLPPNLASEISAMYQETGCEPLTRCLSRKSRSRRCSLGPASAGPRARVARSKSSLNSRTLCARALIPTSPRLGQ